MDSLGWKGLKRDLKHFSFHTFQRPDCPNPIQVLLEPFPGWDNHNLSVKLSAILSYEILSWIWVFFLFTLIIFKCLGVFMSALNRYEL